MKKHETLTEKRIREAIEKGEFDNLPGKGAPIDLSENSFEDPDLRTVHRLLRNAGFAPPWIEERKDIDAAFDASFSKLKRAWELYGKEAADNPNWLRNVREFRESATELNRRIALNNLKTPAPVFHRRLIDVDGELRRVTENETEN